MRLQNAHGHVAKGPGAATLCALLPRRTRTRFCSLNKLQGRHHPTRPPPFLCCRLSWPSTATECPPTSGTVLPRSLPLLLLLLLLLSTLFLPLLLAAAFTAFPPLPPYGSATWGLTLPNRADYLAHHAACSVLLPFPPTSTVNALKRPALPGSGLLLVPHPRTVLQKMRDGARKWNGPRVGLVFMRLRRKRSYFIFWRTRPPEMVMSSQRTTTCRHPRQPKHLP